MKCLFRRGVSHEQCTKSAAEKTFQENFVKELEKYKWKAPTF